MSLNTNLPYTSYYLQNDLAKLNSSFEFLDIYGIGKSVLEKNIYCIKFGSGNQKVSYFASIHANESITTNLLIKFIEDICNLYTSGSQRILNLFSKVTFYIIPLVNPDGVDLVNSNNENLLKITKPIAEKFPDIPFPSGWKSNIRGVDLNLQFPANWSKAKKIKYNLGFNKPAPCNFVGSCYLTEPEAISVYNLCLLENFDLILCYHTQGKEIYWQYQDYAPKKAYDIGLALAQASNYKLTTPDFNSSFAGLKDWFLQKYQKPSFTIEAGLGSNPLPISQFNEIYSDNFELLLKAAELI